MPLRWGTDMMTNAANVSQPQKLACREEGPPPQRRIRLPKPAQQEKSVSLWSILKVGIAAPEPAPRQLPWWRARPSHMYNMLLSPAACGLALPCETHASHRMADGCVPAI